MSSDFFLAFPLFQERVQEFIAASSFESKRQEYTTMLEKINSTLPQHRELYLHKSPDYIQTLEKTLFTMERIISLYDELDRIFKMDKVELGVFCDYDLVKLEQVIGQGLQEAADLLYAFEKVSYQGRKIIEVLEDPFLTQGS